MPFPVTPQQVQEIIPSASASWCAKLLQFPLRLGFLAYKAIKFMVDENGDVTDLFKNWLGLDTVATGDIVPINVDASNGLYTDKIRVTWTFLGNATLFKIFRGPDTDATHAVQIATSTSTSYDDLVPNVTVGDQYGYFIKATVNGVDTDFSLGDMGSVGNTSGGGTQPTGTIILRGSNVPELGVNIPTDGRYILEVWGGGGGSSTSHRAFALGGTGGYANANGSSGGGGGYAKLEVALLAGDLIVGMVGLGGPGGAGVTNEGSGTAGGPSALGIRRTGLAADVVLLQATGGGGALSGRTGGAGGSGETFEGEAGVIAVTPSLASTNPVTAEGVAGADWEFVSNPLPTPVPTAHPGGDAASPLPFVPTAGKGGVAATKLFNFTTPSVLIPAGSAGKPGYFSIKAA